MKLDLYTKAVLTVIAIMLSVIALKPFEVLSTAQAAAPQHQYELHTIPGNTAGLNEFGPGELNKMAAKGCELVAAAGTGGQNSDLVLICRR